MAQYAKLSPDFTKATTEILSKRAGLLCSNPDCRVATAGPTIEDGKYTSIGEAAHIYGARPGSARFDAAMTDSARAEITNSIWLCTNCHRQIDRDPLRYPASLLYRWREDHERFCASRLGSETERIIAEEEDLLLRRYEGYPHVIRRILRDKPPGWEWRLTAELVRHYNGPIFRRLANLRDGAYTLRITYVSDELAFDWIRERLSDLQTLLSPFENVVAMISKSWGAPGIDGDYEEIDNACGLLRDALTRCVEYEELLAFTKLPSRFDALKSLLQHQLGRNIERFQALPAYLDSVLELASTDHGGTRDRPTVVSKDIVFDLPDDWVKQVSHEIERLNRGDRLPAKRPGFVVWFGLFMLILVILQIL